ncbi:MAG: hypothetical protein A3G87_10175 [Omnitrophica bacterium RIFCSPLOWO2_12_FULL_50_11]|nr:MAG: hypothetical protein A3G87_10175 [Omnitrophica bacterium RIFCSPLOWO2_12_FULL_50_11]
MKRKTQREKGGDEMKKGITGVLVILGMLSGTAFAADYYIREGYGGTVLSTNLNTGGTTFFTPTYGGGYLGTYLD